MSGRGLLSAILLQGACTCSIFIGIFSHIYMYVIKKAYSWVANVKGTDAIMHYCRSGEHEPRSYDFTGSEGGHYGKRNIGHCDCFARYHNGYLMYVVIKRISVDAEAGCVHHIAFFFLFLLGIALDCITSATKKCR